MAIPGALGNPAYDELTDRDIYGLIRAQYAPGQAVQTPAPVSQAVLPTGMPGGAPAAAPAPAPAPAAGQQGLMLDPIMLGALANPNSKFGNAFVRLGWTGGDPLVYETQIREQGESGQETPVQVPVGVTPEFEQFVRSKNIQANYQDMGFMRGRGSLFVGGQLVDQFENKPSGFESFMNAAVDVGAAAVLTLATAGAASAALTAAIPGISAATASAVGRALAPTIVQATQTGKVDVGQATRSIVANLVAPSIGAQTASQVSSLYSQATGQALSTAVQQAVSNAAASAAATALQQGADASDLGRNMLAGAISSAVGNTLRSAGVDPSISAGAGRAAGSYISTGSGTQALVSGLTRGLTSEQQQQVSQQERTIQQAYQDPSRALDVERPQAPGPSESEVQAALRAEQVTSPAGAPAPAPEPAAQTIEITGQRQPPSPTAQEAFSDVSATAPAPSPAPRAAPAPSPAGPTPTDIFQFIRRGGGGGPTPSPVARLASMDYPMSKTMGMGGFTPAGELEPGGSSNARQPVWNEASLRLKDALGL